MQDKRGVEVDIASLIGIVACLGLVMFGIVSGDDGMAAIVLRPGHPC